MRQNLGYGGGETLRVGFDLTIAVATRFFSIIFLRRKSGGKGERSASPDSNPPLRTARHKDEFALGEKMDR
ncbi:hypothetical protein [Paenibacillus sp. F4]|uniref:hypothetical protein n=1 Tax=Paenibacillus sp. F4 TaxID=357385 RepID=UPI000C9FD3E0|nr:hypothetical protein [Paenibacillus sp. F4]PNQ80493.1 hypothetical protein C1T21_14615 [Paenibacillus sp. F4]